MPLSTLSRPFLFFGPYNVFPHRNQSFCWIIVGIPKCFVFPNILRWLVNILSHNFLTNCISRTSESYRLRCLREELHRECKWCLSEILVSCSHVVNNTETKAIYCAEFIAMPSFDFFPFSQVTIKVENICGIPRADHLHSDSRCGSISVARFLFVNFYSFFKERFYLPSNCEIKGSDCGPFSECAHIKSSFWVVKERNTIIRFSVEWKRLKSYCRRAHEGKNRPR